MRKFIWLPPGFKFNISDLDDFIKFRLLNENYFSNELVYANDNYAMENPTVVLGSFEEDASLDPGDEWYGGGGSQNPQPNVRYLHEIGVNCTNVQNTDVIRWTMENFRITGNTRDFPHPNRISMWINSASNPTSLAFFDRKKIERGDFGWKTNFIPNNGTIATTWEQFNYNQNLIIGVKRPTNSIDAQTVVYNTDPQGNPVISTTLTIKRQRTYLVTNQSWTRCAELNGNYLVNNGNGFIGDVAIWSYDVGRRGFELQFTIAPQVIRF